MSACCLPECYYCNELETGKRHDGLEACLRLYKDSLWKLNLMWVTLTFKEWLSCCTVCELKFETVDLNTVLLLESECMTWRRRWAESDSLTSTVSWAWDEWVAGKEEKQHLWLLENPSRSSKLKERMYSMLSVTTLILSIGWRKIPISFRTYNIALFIKLRET